MNQAQQSVLTLARVAANRAKKAGWDSSWDKAYYLGMANVANNYVEPYNPIMTEYVYNEIRFLFGDYQK